MKKSFIISIILVILVCVLGVSYILFENNNSTYDRLYSYANKHSEMKISDITNFEWDCAYIDYQHYGNGEDIKQKYNLECDLKTLETDYCYRILFFENNKFIKEELFNYNQLNFVGDIDKFDNNTVFSVSFEKGMEKDNSILVLELK